MRELAQFLETEYRMAMIGIGVFLGGVASLVAVRRFLKV